MTSSGQGTELLTGWGRTAPTPATVAHPGDAAALAAVLDQAPPRGVIARGLGRSYGDPAQNSGGRVADTTGVRGVQAFDPEAGVVTVLAGTSFHDLMADVVPHGWFVPVTPGTRQVTVGGAIASDIHGKDHHRVGSFGSHLSALTLATPTGTVSVSPEVDPDLFWATTGGMGLTGIVLDATIRLRRIETSRLAVDTDRPGDLDEVLALMEAEDHRYRYSVAWLDLTARGRRTGRGILERGDFATPDQLGPRDRRTPLTFTPRTLATAPTVVPPRLINPATVRAFNEAWYHKAPRRRRGHIQTIGSFFHPLDLVDHWNRAYGPRGLLQWQCALPTTAEDVLRAVVGRFSRSTFPSFLEVLKRFGPGTPGPLSFPIEGWTLSVDVAASGRGLGPFLDDLDRQVVEAGGRIYLAKDSRMDPDLLDAMYPRVDEWRKVRDRVDPDHILASDQSRRLRLGG